MSINRLNCWRGGYILSLAPVAESEFDPILVWDENKMTLGEALELPLSRISE
jgi:hypothetical protein